MAQMDLENLIETALQKIGGNNINALCRFIPNEEGYCLHHFTLHKLKRRNPPALVAMLEKYILHVEKPSKLQPQRRAPRGSGTQKHTISLTRGDVSRIAEICRKEAPDIYQKLSPSRSLPRIKKELIRSIQNDELKKELWDAFADAVMASKAAFATARV